MQIARKPLKPQDSTPCVDVSLVEHDQPDEHAPNADQALISLMLEHATDGTALIAHNGTVLATTPAIERMLGLAPRALVGTNGIDLLHPDDVAAALERLDEIGEATNDDFRMYRLRHAHGHWITVEFLANENPEPLAEAPDGSLVLTVRDITEFHETRLALDRSKIRREVIARLASDFVDALDSEIDATVERALATIGTYAGADRTYLFRVRPDFQTMRRTHQWCRAGHEWMSPIDVEVSTQEFPLWRRSIEGLEVIAVDDVGDLDDEWASERTVLSRAGVTAILAVPLIREGAAVGFLGVDVVGRTRTWGEDEIGMLQVATDIVGSALARRDTSHESRASEARFRALVDLSSDPIIVIDREGRINHMPIGTQLFGYQPEDLYGTNALDLIHPDDLEFAAGELINAVLDPDYRATNGMRIRHADGHWVPIELVASSRFDEPSIDGVIMNVRDVTERELAAGQLRDSEERLRTLIANLPGAVFRCGAAPPHYDEFVSEQVEQFTGYTPAEFIAREITFEDQILPEHQRRTSEEFQRAVEAHRPYVTEYPIRHRDGSVRWVSEHGAIVYSEDGEAQFIEGFIFDITARVEAVEESETRLGNLIANVPGAVFRCEATAPYRDMFISEAIEDLTGYPAALFLRNELELYDLVVPEHQAKVDRIVQASFDRGGSYCVEYQFRHRDGTLRWVEERGQVMFGPDGNPKWIDGAMLDLGERKQLEDQLAHDAGHDHLTGLPNRALLLSHLEQALAHTSRSSATTAVLFLDLDRFKLVNDALGHTAGDELLVHFTRRLLSVMRSSDLAARTGGDEFVIVCTDLDDPSDAEIIAGRVADVLRDPFTIHGRSIFVTASIGIAFAETGATAGDVLRSADAAAYRAKDRGRNRYEVFDEALRAATAAALETETDLHRALDRHQLFLRYQPVIELETGRMAGAEGLIRWQHPERGLLTPDQFLPAAEASGLIVAMGREVLQLAVGAMSNVDQTTIPTIAVNLAPRELAQPDLVERVRRTLDEHGVPAQRLCIEITESAVLDDVEMAIATLEALRSLGVRLAIDDFGTGYSSLSYLRRLPVDIVKIDRSFTSEIGDGESNLTIIAGIIGLARGLGLEVIAEGIETVRQLTTLRELGCTFGQGFLFAPPIALDDLLALPMRPPEPLPMRDTDDRASVAERQTRRV